MKKTRARSADTIEIPVRHEKTIGGRIVVNDRELSTRCERNKISSHSSIDVNVDEFHSNENLYTENIQKGTLIICISSIFEKSHIF